MCPQEVRSTKSSSKVEVMADQQEIVSRLVPDYTYIISVAAVNRAGKGKTAAESMTTLAEGRLDQR